MKLTKNEKEVLKCLSEGDKIIYQIHKEVSNKIKSIHYTTVQRILTRFEEKDLITTKKIKSNRGSLDAKLCKITTAGLIYLYHSLKDKDDALKFHRSKPAQKIINKLIKSILYSLSEDDEKILPEIIRNSPSSLNYIYDIVNIRTINNPQLFKELFKNQKFRDNILLKKGSVEEKHLEYLEWDLPIKILSEDLGKFQKDKKIRDLFFKVLLRKQQRDAKKRLKQDKIIFNAIIKAIKKGIIDAKKPSESEWKKFINYSTEEYTENIEKVDCLKHLYIYLPKGGEAQMVCNNLKCKYC
jgi:DNA-binding PadR family transcriptional regulator